MLKVRSIYIIIHDVAHKILLGYIMGGVVKKEPYSGYIILGVAQGSVQLVLLSGEFHSLYFKESNHSLCV